MSKSLQTIIQEQLDSEMRVSAELNHGCRGVCSGWQQGYEEGCSDSEKIIAERDHDLDIARSLVKEICDEWNEDCEPKCDSYGHEEKCQSVNIAEAKKAMRLKIAKLENQLKIAVDALKNYSEGVHDESPYIAKEALEKIDKFSGANQA